VYDYLFVIIELFSLALTVEALQGKTCQYSLLSGGGRSVWSKISGEGVVPGEYFFYFYNTSRHILLYDSANCTVLRAVVLTQYRRVTERRTDRQTDGRNCYSYSIALAMPALRRAVMNVIWNNAFRRIFQCCWRECVSCLLYYRKSCQCHT